MRFHPAGGGGVAVELALILWVEQAFSEGDQ